MPDTSTDFTLEYLWAEAIKIWVILQRPVVQIQVLGIALAICLSWLFSHWAWQKLQQRFPQLYELEVSQSRLTWRQYGSVLLGALLMPTLSLGFLSLLFLGFQQWGGFAGYFKDAILVFWDFWFYRLFLVSLYVLFPAATVTHYRSRFFSPLFWLIISGKILSWFADLSDLAQVSVFRLFGGAVTLKAAFVTIAGLYFWIVGTSLVEKILFRLIFGSKISDPRITQVTSLLLRYSLIGLGIVLIFGYVGVNPAAFAAITGGLSVGIGFGLKEVISNFVSGIWLLLEGALKPGDIIEVEDRVCKVTSLGIRATTVQVFQDNSEEIIPNQIFFTENVTTFTGSDHLVYRSVTVGASYQCSPPKVIAILLQIAKQHERILQMPPPQAYALGFGDSSIDFELKFWLDDPTVAAQKFITSQVICQIWQAFAENDIEIPFPQRDLHLRSNQTQLETNNFSVNQGLITTVDEGE